MSCSGGNPASKDYSFIPDTASDTVWVTGTKRRHTCSSSENDCSASEDAGKRVKQEM